MTTQQTNQPAQPAHPPATVPTRAGSGRSAELHEFLAALLRFQCRLVGAQAGAVYLSPGRGNAGGVIVTHRDEGDGALDEASLQRLTALAARAAAGVGAPLAEPITLQDTKRYYTADASHIALATPLRAEGRVEGATLVVAPAQGLDSDDALARLGLTTARFEAYLWRQSALHESQQKVVLKETLELLDRAQQGQTARSMASLMAGELRRRFGCTRVSIGLIAADRVRVMAVSGADDLDPRSPAVEAIEAAMEETALQDAEVLYPEPEGASPGARRVIHQHARLSELFGPAAIISIPLRIDGGLVGVMVLERDQTDPFPEASLPLMRLVAEFIGPAVYTRRLADRRTPQVLRDDLRDLAGAIVGPRHTLAKTIGALVLLALVLLALVPIPDRVVATFELRATVSRAIVPPFAGYLERAHVRPGDRVAAGDLLVEMKTDDLRLRLVEAEARRENLLARRDAAMARGERAQARQTQAEIDETDATIALVAESLRAAQLTAPIAGVVSLGDLERLSGAPVDANQVLLEIVADGTTAVLQIAERDADRVAVGQTGWIAPRGSPGSRIPVTVTRINPVAQVRETGSMYLVEASVAEGTALQPGMTGSVRLRDGWTTGLAALARPLIDAARLRLWW